jgi:pyruvate dehydrogenase E2 component (dihydrolipoyllysine-residue acetyltransferase)
MATICGKWGKRLILAIAITLGPAACAMLDEATATRSAGQPIAVEPPPDDGVSHEPRPVAPVAREARPGPIALAPAMTEAPQPEARPEEPHPGPTPAAVASPAPPAPAVEERPTASAAPARAAALPAPDPACPPGSVGVWSRDLISAPVYVCRQASAPR